MNYVNSYVYAVVTILSLDAMLRCGMVAVSTEDIAMAIITYEKQDAIETARQINGYWFALGACFVVCYR